MFVRASEHMFVWLENIRSQREKELYGQSRVSESVEINTSKKEQKFKSFQSKNIAKSSHDSLHIDLLNKTYSNIGTIG
jgi:hypothetical protein